MRVCAVFFVLAALAAVSAAQESQPEPPKLLRHALILGNANYRFLPPIPAVVHESALMSEALQKAGFADIVTVADFELEEFAEKTVPAFLSRVQPGDVCFVYYSGYSVQADGDTFLLPVDFNPKLKSTISASAYSLSLIQQSLENAGIRIIVVEASRDLDPSFELDTSSLPVDSAELHQTLFAFAASPSQSTHSAPDTVGLFTNAVAGTIVKPGIEINQVFPEVQRAVARQTKQAQVPYIAGVITTDLVLVAAPPPVKAPPPPVNLRATGFPATNSRDREEYVWIPASDFLMGCVPKDTKCRPDEKPQHKVSIAQGFWMGRNEVQAKAYRRFVESKKGKMPPGPIRDSKWSKDDRPIANVSWTDAGAYCEWVGGRLPTEAEWEYSARGGLANQVYPLDSEDSRENANFAGKKGNDRWDQETAPVRSFNPNPFRLFDMAGNVWEWVLDWYSPTYYAESEPSDPKGPKSGKEHVYRGGSFDSTPDPYLRISIRQHGHKGENNIGFRCVLPDSPATEKLLRGIK